MRLLSIRIRKKPPAGWSGALKVYWRAELENALRRCALSVGLTAEEGGDVQHFLFRMAHLRRTLKLFSRALLRLNASRSLPDRSGLLRLGLGSLTGLLLRLAAFHDATADSGDPLEQRAAALLRSGIGRGPRRRDEAV